MTTLNDTSDKYTCKWQQIYMYIVTNEWYMWKIYMKMIPNTHELTFICYTIEMWNKITRYQDVLRSKLYLIIMRLIVAKKILPISADSYMCRQFEASVFGHQLVLSIHDYLSLLVVTSLYIHLETTRQFVASVFSTPLGVRMHSKLYLFLVVYNFEYKVNTHSNTI